MGIGGQGRNELYAWSRLPQPTGDKQFGVFVDPTATDRSSPNFGVLFDDSGDFSGAVDSAGNPIPDGKLDSDPSKPARVLENTGLNRVLGGPNDDSLFGGTGLDFLYGNGGNDTLYRANGSTFDVYVNHQMVTSIRDSAYSQGHFGFSAGGNTEVAYTNARMWTL